MVTGPAGTPVREKTPSAPVVASASAIRMTASGSGSPSGVDTDPARSNTGTVVVVVVGGSVVVVVVGGTVVVVVVVACVAGVAGSWAIPVVQAAVANARAVRRVAILDMRNRWYRGAVPEGVLRSVQPVFRFRAG
jgi:hypothetical protein